MRLRTSADRQFIFIVRFVGDKIFEQLRVRGGEGFKDGLVGIAHAHPVAVTREKAQNIFLNFARVLRLIFEDEGETVLQARKIFGIGLQNFIGERDEVIKVHCAAIAQGLLIFVENPPAHFSKRKRRGRIVQSLAQVFGGDGEIFARTNERKREAVRKVGQLLTAHPITF